MESVQYTTAEKITLIENNNYAVRTSKYTTRSGSSVSTSKVSYAYQAGVKSSVDAAFDAVVKDLLLTVNPSGSGGGAYSAGDGIDITGAVISADFSGSGSEVTVSRSDHNHTGVYDNYHDWALTVADGSPHPGTEIITGFELTFEGSTYIDVSYAAHVVTISYSGAQPKSWSAGGGIEFTGGSNDVIGVDVYGAHLTTTGAHTPELEIVADGHNHTGASISDLATGDITSGILSVERGGTGLGTVGTNYLLTGNGTGALTAESTLLYSGGNLTVGNGIWTDSNEMFFNESHEDWQTDGTTTPTMDIDVSRNMELTPSTNATTLDFDHEHDGMSGVVVIDSSSDGVLTLPTDSHPLTLNYANATRTIASFVKYGTEYIWQSTTFANAPL